MPQLIHVVFCYAKNSGSMPPKSIGFVYYPCHVKCSEVVILIQLQEIVLAYDEFVQLCFLIFPNLSEQVQDNYVVILEQCSFYQFFQQMQLVVWFLYLLPSTDSLFEDWTLTFQTSPILLLIYLIAFHIFRLAPYFHLQGRYPTKVCIFQFQPELLCIWLSITTLSLELDLILTIIRSLVPCTQ